MRPYWKGYLKLALVSCPIALHAACSTSERVAFRQINKATGNRLRQQLIDEDTRQPVDPEHKGRGYEIARGQYIIVEDEEIDAIEIESTHVIEIDSFVPVESDRPQDCEPLNAPAFEANAGAGAAAPAEWGNNCQHHAMHRMAAALRARVLCRCGAQEARAPADLRENRRRARLSDRSGYRRLRFRPRRAAD